MSKPSAASSSTVPLLLAPLAQGALVLRNRVALAPMTRSRAGEGRTVGPLQVAYYAQRAAAGLLITEGAQVSPQGIGYTATPGIHTDAQRDAWRLVTDAVHARGGTIFLQLWHVGPISLPAFQPEGGLPVSASAIAPQGQTWTPEGMVPYGVPRALETAELPGIVAQFVHGARTAIAAGFDGVEIHGANSYLLDQFLRDGGNQRTDAYGGSVENRVRLLVEVARGVADAIGADRTGVRLSPLNPFNGIADSDPLRTFTHAARALAPLGLAYLHLNEGAAPGREAEAEAITTSIRAAWPGVLIINGGYTRERAEEAIASGRGDVVAFGVPYLANPDLVERFALDAPLNAPDASTFYGGDARGYTDYPTLADLAAQAA